MSPRATKYLKRMAVATAVDSPLLAVREECPRLSKILGAAQLHGEESEPDHEVGDLQEVLRECWKRMTPAARREVYELESVQALLEEWS